jgi:hypothetical protein
VLGPADYSNRQALRAAGYESFTLGKKMLVSDLAARLYVSPTTARVYYFISIVLIIDVAPRKHDGLGSRQGRAHYSFLQCAMNFSIIESPPVRELRSRYYAWNLSNHFCLDLHWNWWSLLHSLDECTLASEAMPSANVVKQLVQRLMAEIDCIANTQCPLAERAQQIAELEDQIDRLQRTEEAIVVATGAHNEAGH